jgi:hypothetical protein
MFDASASRNSRAINKQQLGGLRAKEEVIAV